MARQAKRKTAKAPARKGATKRSRKLTARRPKNRTTDLVTGKQIRPKQADEDFRLFDSFLKIFEPSSPRKK